MNSDDPSQPEDGPATPRAFADTRMDALFEQHEHGESPAISMVRGANGLLTLEDLEADPSVMREFLAVCSELLRRLEVPQDEYNRIMGISRN